MYFYLSTMLNATGLKLSFLPSTPVINNKNPSSIVCNFYKKKNRFFLMFSNNFSGENIN